MNRVRLIGAVLLAAIASVTGAATPQKGSAIVGATVLPMTKASRLSDQTVLIAGDRIVAVGPRSKVRVPNGYRVINGRGLTVMPGLVDTHVHIDNSAGEKDNGLERGLSVMLAHGITTIRGTAGAPTSPALRDRVERGEIPSPRLYVGTPPINDDSAPDAAAARQWAVRAKKERFDFIKVQDLKDPVVWRALIDEAAKQGVPAAGHVTDKYGLFPALAAGQQVEHLEGVPRELLPPDSPALKEYFGQIPAPHLVKALSTVTDADIARVAKRVRAAGGYHGPNLAFFERVWDVVTPLERRLDQPGMAYIAKPIVDQWSLVADNFKQTGAITPESARTMIALRRKLVRAFYDAGVPLMAGSASPQVFQPYGVGLVRELEAFVQIGIPPMDALRTATVVPRNYIRSLKSGGSALGWKPDFGTIEPGARADVILVAGDPSRNVSALRSVRTVIAGGRVYDRPALDAILRKAAAEAKR